MSVESIVQRLRDRGVELWVEGDGLRFRAPQGALTAELKAEVGAHRPAVIEWLKAEAMARVTVTPVSCSQKSLWFVQQEDPGSAAYHVAFAAAIRSTIDVAALRRSLQTLVDRHAALRTVYRMDRDGLQQVVKGYADVAFECHALPGMGGPEVRQCVEAGYRQPFNLADGPLFRCALYSAAPDDNVLLLVVHHIAADGWSLFQMIDELRALYTQHTGGAAAQFERPAVECADYAAAELGLLSSPAGARLEQFWRGYLQEPRELVELPTDRRRPARRSSRGATQSFAIDADLGAATRNYARSEGTTTFVVLLAAFKALLYRLTGTRDVIVGTPTFGRDRPEFARVVGNFINMIPLRAQVEGGASFRTLTAAVKQAQVRALSAQEYPFSLLVERLQPSRDAGHAPFFDTMFLLQRFDQLRELEPLLAPADAQAVVDFAGLKLAPYALDQQEGQFDLTLQVVDCAGPMLAQLKYLPDLFDHATVSRIARQYVQLLRSAVGHPACSIDTLELTGAAELAALTRGQGAAASPAATGEALGTRFSAQVLRSPDAIAVGYDGEQITYRELHRRVNQFARRLAALGVGPGDLVAVCMARTPELLVVLLAIELAGGAYVPLDPDFPPDRLTYMLEDSGARLLVTTGGLADELVVPGGTAVLDPRAERQAIAALDASHLEPVAGPGHPAYVLYTSGSTGLPKGVVVSRGALSNFLESMAREPGLTAHDVLAAVTTISFDIAGLELYLPLIVGARVELIAREVAMDGPALAQALHDRGATVLQATPATWRMLVECGWRPAAGFRAFAGGEALPQDLADALLERVDELWNLYGPTETTIWSTLSRVAAAPAPITVGHPIANTQVYVLDEARRPTPLGVPGEIWIGGDGVALGYHRRPELTAERFVPDPFTERPAARMYRTGDLGRWDDHGNLHHLGRLDNQVKIRGYRIELGEIEAVLARHPDIRQAVVNPWKAGVGDTRLAAYVVLAVPGAKVDEKALRTHMAARLPDYMIPAVIVELERVPLTPNGKIDRKALPVPEARRIAVEPSAHDRPLSDTERQLVAIWSDLLRVAHISVHDNFFHLGGHSLLVIQLLERLRRNGLQADVRTVFLHPTVESLAAAICAGGPVPAERAVAQAIPPGCRRIEPAMLPLVQLQQAQIDAIVAGVPGGAGNVQDIYPLLPWQEGLLFHRMMLEPGEADPYVGSADLEFTDRNAFDAFCRALQGVIDRHDALRTAVHWEDLDQPVQLVQRAATLAVAPQATLDLHRPPLIGIDLRHDAAAGPITARLLVHHIIVDNISFASIVREIGAIIAGQGAALQPPAPMREFVASTLSADVAPAEEFFRSMLADAKEPTHPYGLSVAETDDATGREFRASLDAGLAEQLRRAARVTHLSPAALFHAAWSLLVAGTSERRDVVFGTVLAGRFHGLEGGDRAVGMFINTLPLRVVLDERSVIDVVREVQDRLASLGQHERASLARVQRFAPLPRGTALFTALFNYRHVAPEAAAARDSGPITIAPGVRLVAGHDRTNFPLSAAVDDADVAFSVTIQCAGSVDPAQVHASFSSCLQRLAAALLDARRANAPVSALIAAPVPVQAPPPPHAADAALARAAAASLMAAFARQARARPGDVAIAADGAELSYDELRCRSNRLAVHLRTLGIGPGEMVAVCLPRTPDLLVALLAVQGAGGAYVPLDPHFPPDRLAYMLEDSGARVLVTSPGAHVELRTPPGMRVLDLAAEGPAIGRPGSEDLAPLASPADPAYVLYTSGSTGRPKGVVVSHGALANFLASMAQEPGLHSSDVLAAVTTISFDIAGLELYLPLYVGARIELVARDVAMDAAALAQLLATSGATVLQATPATWRMLVESGWRPVRPLRALCGGEALPRDLADALLARVEELWNLYGPTETTIWSTLTRVEPSPAPITVGHPIANTQVYVLDDQLQPVLVGMPGEIWIGGDGVAIGYHRRPDLTAERFLADPFSIAPSARMYRTGDLGRWDEQGRLHHMGRLDQQVKIRGYRIELGEIEALLASHPAVRQAVVNPWQAGAGDTRLAAYIVPREPGRPLDEAALREHLARQLPDYMLPAVLLAIDRLPLTPNGKIDRKALAPPDAGAMIPAAHDDAAPATDTERRVAAIWAEVLKLPRVGRDDNFFARGGHSLLVARVASRLRAAFGVELPLRTLFDVVTLHELAAHVDGLRNRGDRTECIPVVARTERPPLSFAQQRLWYFQQLEPGSTLFNLPLVLRLSGTLDTAAFEQSIAAVLARHESLRTFFPQDADEPWQQVAPVASAPVRFSRVQVAPGGDAEAALLEAIRDEAAAPFDLAAGPLTRVRLIQFAHDGHALVVTFHHAIADGVSTSLFVRDWAECYRATVERRAPVLPDLAIQYIDFAAWQRQWLTGPRLAEQIGYWRSQLEGAPPYIDLPLDRPRPPVQTYRGAVVRRTVPRALRSRLESASQHENATLFMTLYAAFAHVLARHSGQDDISMGLAVAGRNAPETENMIGLFINTLVLRSRLQPGMSFEALLRAVREASLGAYAHQDLPFERLVEDLRPPRDLSRTPLFQVLFNMLDLGAAAGLSLPMLQVGPFDALPSTGLQAKFDLTLYVHDEREGLGLTIVYNADLFDPQRIEDLLDQYGGLLEAVSLDAALPLAEQSLVTRHGAQLLPDPEQPLQYSWNGSVMARVLQHAKSGPDRLAVQDRDVALSYADLQSLSSRLARHLVAQGVASGDRVAIHAERNAGLVWAMLGVLQAGAAFVVLDSAYPPERLAASLRIAVPKAFIDVSEAGPADGLEAQLAATPGLVRVAWGAAAEPAMRAWRDAPDAALEDSTGPRDLAYLVFTSGSTGVPKAVAGEHAPLSHFFQWHQDTWGLGPADRFGVLSGLAHDPLLRDVLAALWAGATVVMPDPDLLTAPAELLHWLDREAVSVIHLTPSMADLLGIGEEGGSAAPLPALRHAFFGGDQLRGSTVATMRRLAPNAQLVNFYGASETPQAMAFHAIDAAQDVPSAARVPVGRGIADAQLLVLTPSRRLAGIGELGEIAIRTPYLARGYFGDDALTAERFISNPATGIEGDRLYLTGDLGRYRPDGSVDLAGRRDGQVKIRGFRIEIGEVEAALASHASVRRAVVLCREAAPADPRLVAYVVYDPGNDLTVSDVRRYLRGKLPEYMIPSVVVTVEAIPLTPNGKLDRAALPDPFLQARVAAADPEPLRPGLEQDMAAIWRELLQVSSAGPLDNFFDLGGHSLLSLRVVATIERKLGLRIDPRSLFFLNLRQIVALIEAERPAVRHRLET